MTRSETFRRAVSALPVSAVLLLNTSGIVAAPASAEVASCEGVFLAIDDGTTVTTACVDLTEGTGFDVLNAAGVDYAFVPGVPGFVCTINDSPRPCNNAPVHAYWSYWQATTDGPWTCASQGAATTQVVAPAREGWAFGTGDTPPQIDDARTVATSCRGGSTTAADGAGTQQGVAPNVPMLTLGVLAATAAVLAGAGLRRRRLAPCSRDDVS